MVIVLEWPKGPYAWQRFPKSTDFWVKFTLFRLTGLWRDLAGIVRGVWGSTRGTPMPCRWFMGFVERQAPRRYRMVVLGWTPLSQKPIPRPDTQHHLEKLHDVISLKNRFPLGSISRKKRNFLNRLWRHYLIWSTVFACFLIESPLKPLLASRSLGGAK